jgi:hypothetical protein
MVRRRFFTSFQLLVIGLLVPAERSISAPTADSLITLTSSNLPIIVIDTHGQDIRDEPKITADMGVVENGAGQRNSPGDPFNGYNGKIGIEIRGSSSQTFPKKQFAVETRDTAGNELNVPLLGLPDGSDWVLYAVYNDKSLIRDALMFTIARSLGRYASRARYCELILNGEYAGVYLLLEKVGRGKNRVNISKLSAADTLGDAATGGYIVKIDKSEGASTGGWYSGLPPYPWATQRIRYQYHYPKAENLVWPQQSYITLHFRDLEVAMYGSGYADSASGYPHWMDVDALVDYILLNELGKNVDEFRLSFFMYKDRDSRGGKLVMGPLWDYTLAFGNCDYYDASMVDGFQWTYLTENTTFLHDDLYQVPFWMKKLLNDPTIRGRLRQRWNALRVERFSLGRITEVVDSLTALLAESRQRNFVRWSILGQYVWPNAFVGKTYEEEINYLKDWVDQRLRWLDGAFNTSSAGDSHGGADIPGRFELAQNYPNPFNPFTTMTYTVGGTRGRGVGVSDVSLVVYDMLGRRVATLVNERKMPGRYEATIDGSNLASGIYYYRLTAGTFVETRKALLVK